MKRTRNRNKDWNSKNTFLMDYIPVLRITTRTSLQLRVCKKNANDTLLISLGCKITRKQGSLLRRKLNGTGDEFPRRLCDPLPPVTAVLHYRWLAAGLHDKIISLWVGGHSVFVGIRHPNGRTT